MRKFRLTAVSFVFAALFAVSAFAQTSPPQTSATAVRIVVINTAAFGDEKAGITKYINAVKALNTELKPDFTTLQDMNTRMQTLQKDFTGLQEQAKKPNSPISEQTLKTKYDELQNMDVEFKRKQEDFKAKSERRTDQVLGTVTQEIMKAIQDFTKQKGYGLVLDAARLDAAQLILGYDEAKVDVTKEFIQFYNTRSPTTATTTAK